MTTGGPSASEITVAETLALPMDRSKVSRRALLMADTHSGSARASRWAVYLGSEPS